MCGIAGILAAGGRPRPLPMLAAMERALLHRGPDDGGFLAWAGTDAAVGPQWNGDAATTLGLAHRRLSILDLSAQGWQPMLSADRRQAIVFNGEIYNFLELRRELEALGHHFRSTSDTEVLLAAWRQWDTAALPRLIGMFAFAVVDFDRRRLTLARDHFGIKPLFITRAGGHFAFASEIKALLVLPWLRRTLDVNAAYQYLAYGTADTAESTFFAEISRLPAGHSLTIDLDTAAPGTAEPYWSLPQGQAPQDLTADEAAERLRALFLDSVSLHQRSDVPIGAALSGGIDSSAIVCGARRLGEATAGLHCIGFTADDACLNEDKWMRMAAEEAGASLHRVRLHAEDLERDLDRLIAAQDEPFGSTSIYAQYKVFEAARASGLKVMLDGQGADEMLGGYAPFLAHRVADMLRGGQLLALRRYIAALAADVGASPKALLAHGLAATLPQALRDRLRERIGEPRMPDWLNADWMAARGVRTGTQWRSHGTGLRAALRRSFTESSLPSLLRYEDRNSMAHSVESRVPFLTPALVEFLFSLPPEHLIDERGVTKSVLRRAMAGIVPAPILARRDKIGFQTPEQAWLHDLAPWIDDILATARRYDLLDSDAVAQQWSLVRRGEAPADGRCWRWVNFLRWAEVNRVDCDGRGDGQ